MSPKGPAAPDYQRHPFQQTAEETIQFLQTDTDSGLAPAKAKELQSKYGPNKLTGEGGVKWYSVLLKQVSNAMILVSPTQLNLLSSWFY
jgi:Na+-exporting ATPase